MKICLSIMNELIKVFITKKQTIDEIESVLFKIII